MRFSFLIKFTFLRIGDTAMTSGVNIGDQLVEVQLKNEIYEQNNALSVMYGVCIKSLPISANHIYHLKLF